MEEGPTSALGSNVDQVRDVLRVLQPTDRLVFAQATLPLYPTALGEPSAVTALSPSSDSILRGITALAEAAAHRKAAFARRYRAPDTPNEASVATLIRCGSIAAILGADLEAGNNPKAGWNAVMDLPRVPHKATLVKVPHHGSNDAFHEGLWRELSAEDALAIVTPLAKGANRLPGDEDIQRLFRVTSRVLLGAQPSLGKSHRDRESAKILKRYHGRDVFELRGWGHIRARRAISDDDAEWDIQLDGDAAWLHSP